MSATPPRVTFGAPCAGCTAEYWQLPQENGKDERYLVYAREGKVLRTHHIPMDEQVMSGRDEAAFVRGR